MMAAYPDNWQWTNGIQQERGRMLLGAGLADPRR